MVKVKIGQCWKSLGTREFLLQNPEVNLKQYEPWPSSLKIGAISLDGATFENSFRSSFGITYSNNMLVKIDKERDEYVVVNPQLWQLIGVPCIKCNKYCKQDCSNYE